GRIVEQASTDELYARPRHPYTETLLAALPRPDPRLRGRARRQRPRGEVPDPANPPAGCTFHPRCPYAEDVCRDQEPPLLDIGGHHLSRCRFAEELRLDGVAAGQAGDPVQ